MIRKHGRVLFDVDFTMREGGGMLLNRAHFFSSKFCTIRFCAFEWFAPDTKYHRFGPAKFGDWERFGSMHCCTLCGSYRWLCRVESTVFLRCGGRCGFCDRRHALLGI